MGVSCHQHDCFNGTGEGEVVYLAVGDELVQYAIRTCWGCLLF